MGFAMHTIVKLLMVVESVSRINHDRNSGALESLLVTPLPVKWIMAAQQQALRAHFRRSTWMLCLLNLALILGVFGFSAELDTDGKEWVFTEIFTGGMLAVLVDREALLWVGMWHGLAKRQVYKAVFFTALQLLGPCWFLAFIGLVTDFSPTSDGGVAIMFAAWFLVGWVVDAISMGVARSRLNKRFRKVAADNS
jgi:hypothetical protein